MHLFGPKMSRQISVVDFIQQYLPIRRLHHQSKLLFYAFMNQVKPMFGHNMELSMTLTCSTSQFPHFNVWWILRGLIITYQEGGFKQPMMKQSHWLSILRKLSPYSYITGICSQVSLEWLGLV